MSKLSNFMIFLNNLSDIYIISTVTVAFAIALTFYCTNFMNRNLQLNSKGESNNRKQYGESMDEDESDSEKELLGKFKTARLKEIEKTLTEDQIAEERKIEQAQLAAIYELLKKQEAELNTTEIDENELKEQLNLYR